MQESAFKQNSIKLIEFYHEISLFLALCYGFDVYVGRPVSHPVSQPTIPGSKSASQPSSHPCPTDTPPTNYGKRKAASCTLKICISCSSSRHIGAVELWYHFVIPTPSYRGVVGSNM